MKWLNETIWSEINPVMLAGSSFNLSSFGIDAAVMKWLIELIRHALRSLAQINYSRLSLPSFSELRLN